MALMANDGLLDFFNDNNEDSDDSWTPLMEVEFLQHKRNYYREKMDYGFITK